MCIRDSYYTAWKAFGKAGEQAIDRWVSPHELRRSFVSEHSRAGTPLHQVQALLGHKSQKTTADWYFYLGRHDKANIQETAGIKP